MAPSQALPSWIPIDREGLAELDESASSRYWHDPDRKPGLPANLRAKSHMLRISSELGNKEDVMPHFMIRWQFTSTSAKALVGKPHDRPARRRHSSKASAVS